MAQYGSTIYSTIESRVSAERKVVNGIQSKIRDASGKIGSFERKIQTAYGKLANLYLPELEEDDIRETFQVYQQMTQEIFEEKQERKMRVERLIEVNQSGLEETSLLLQSTSTSLTKVGEDIIETQKRVEGILDENSEYKSLQERKESLNSQIDNATETLVRVESFANDKRDLFESSKLFTYLYNKGIGNVDVNVSFGDKWLSRVIGYEDARKKYQVLEDLPKSARENVNEIKSELDDVLSQELIMVQYVEHEEGLVGLRQELRTLTRTKFNTEKDLHEIEENERIYSAELDSFENTRGKYHSTALSKIKTHLKKENLASLMHMAKQTETLEDDKLVEEIQRYTSEITKQEEFIGDYKQEEKEAKGVLSKVIKVRDNFSRNGYSSSDSRFNYSFDADDLITAYVLGKRSEYNVMNDFSSDHWIEEPPAPAYTPSYSSPYSNSSSSSSDDSWGGGGFSSDDSFGGGGFTTDDDF